MFEWDEVKNEANIRKHGIGFARAVHIFDGPVWTVEDARFDYGEVRLVSVGLTEGILYLTIVHTKRGEVTRIISARASNRQERRRYEKEIRERADR